MYLAHQWGDFYFPHSGASLGAGCPPFLSFHLALSKVSSLCSVRMPNRSFEIAIRYLYTVFSVSRGKTSPIKRPRVRQDETHIIVQGTRHVLSRRPCIYTGGKIEDAKDFCLNRLAVFRRGRAGPARAGLPRGVDRAVKEVSGLPPARGTSETSAACWQARVLIKTWAARPARHRRARRGPRGRVARPSARR